MIHAQHFPSNINKIYITKSKVEITKHNELQGLNELINFNVIISLCIRKKDRIHYMNKD